VVLLDSDGNVLCGVLSVLFRVGMLVTLAVYLWHYFICSSLFIYCLFVYCCDIDRMTYCACISYYSHCVLLLLPWRVVVRPSNAHGEINIVLYYLYQLVLYVLLVFDNV